MRVIVDLQTRKPRSEHGNDRPPTATRRPFKPPSVEVSPRIDRLLRRFVVRRFWKEQGMDVRHRPGFSHGLIYYEAMRITDEDLFRWTEKLRGDDRKDVLLAVWKQREMYFEHQRAERRRTPESIETRRCRSGPRSERPADSNRLLRRVFDLATEALRVVGSQEADRPRKIADQIVSGLTVWYQIRGGLVSGLRVPAEDHASIDESRRLSTQFRAAVRTALDKKRRGELSKAVAITHEIAPVLFPGMTLSERHLRRVLNRTARSIPRPDLFPSGT